VRKSRRIIDYHVELGTYRVYSHVAEVGRDRGAELRGVAGCISNVTGLS